jgi:Uma2 family endonuclease
LPDLAIVADGDYDAECPTSALLIVEVSLSSLRKDRRVKGPLYAENGVPEYWVVNAAERLVEVHREPRHGRYATERSFGVGETIALVKFPDVSVAVAEVFG